MNKKFSLALIVIILLGIFLTACNRPASEAPSANPTQSFPFPLAPTQGVSQFATQTAAAKLPAVVTPTPQPGQVVKTPGVVPTTAATTVATTVVIQQPTAKPTEKPTLAPPPATRPDSYTIQQGEFPVCIARRYDLDLGDFLAVNGLTMNSRVAIGASLKIPSGGNWSANYGSRSLAAHPDTYVVQANDSIGKIACTYGDVSPEAILAANGMTKASEIQAGQSLKIP